MTESFVIFDLNKELVQRGIARLHDLIDARIETILRNAGDDSTIVEVDQAVNDVIDPSCQWQGTWNAAPLAWRHLWFDIMQEWDFLLHLYYIDGLRGEDLTRAAAHSPYGK